MRAPQPGSEYMTDRLWPVESLSQHAPDYPYSPGHRPK